MTDQGLIETVIFENEQLTERIAALELALEDASWMRISMQAEQEFSRDGLRQVCEIARIMYLKNPLLLRGVNTQRDYVFGQGVTIKADDEQVNEVVQAFLNDSKNQAELTSHQAMGYKEVDLAVEGNLFFVLFTDAARGRVRVRSITFDQIADIICNPDDAKEPWYYKRVWTESRVNLDSGLPEIVTKEAYYPDWRYSTTQKRPMIGGNPVYWNAPVYHVRVGGMSHWKFGLSEVYAAIDWAKAYKQFLEDWATITRALSRFAWNLTTKGGKSAIQQAKSKLQTTLSTGGPETNPPPVAGSTFIGGEDVALNPVRTAGATTSAEDGRRLLLMVASAVGLPESFFGDVSVGNLATAKSLDRPTELKMRSRQSLWADVIGDMIRYALRVAVQAGKLAGTVIQDGDDFRLELPGDADVRIEFPPILEHDVAASVSAIVDAATLKGSSPAGTIDHQTLARKLLTAIGVDDVEAALTALDKELEQQRLEDEEAQERAAQLVVAQAQNKGGQEPDPEQRAEEALREAIRDLREVLHAQP